MKCGFFADFIVLRWRRLLFIYEAQPLLNEGESHFTNNQLSILNYLDAGYNMFKAF